jgi:chemotaxis-related protein WspB
MLLLLFETSGGRYALDSRQIIEIIPLLLAKRIPGAPGYVAGIVNYRGTAVPVLDLCAFEGGNPCRILYSTRIIIVNYRLESGETTLVGLMAERITETIKCRESDVRSSGILLEKKAGLEDGESGQDEIVQLFDAQRMLPADIIQDLL